MKEMVFVIDESGAKGYSTNTEQYPGEVGVAAGYMFPSQFLSEVRSELDLIISSFTVNGKLHITDLKPEDQAKLRREIFQFFISHRVPWVYEAIYVEGMYSSVAKTNVLSEKFWKETVSKIKLSVRPEVELLHAKLFSGAVIKAIAFQMDQGVGEFMITIITDRVDSPIINMFRKEIDEFLTYGAERTLEVRGYDLEQRKPFKSVYKTQVEVNDSWAIDLSGIQYEIQIDNSSLTLAADVLVNSVHYHLKKRQSEWVGVDLNSGDPVYDHPLRRFLYGLPQGEMPWLTDVIYAHPDRGDAN